MCFSAQASFTSGVVLSGAGIATFRKTTRPDQKVFSAIPFLFAFQQFAEGVLWITLKSGGFALLQNVAEHVFLTAALVGWPFMVPLPMYLMEPFKPRKKTLAFFTAAGGALSLAYAYCLVFYRVTPQIVGFHLQYNDQFPGEVVHYALAVYMTVTIVPLFISSVRRMWIFGTLIAVSCVVTGIFYSQYLTSVWCFFAAGMSVAIYWILHAPAREPVPVRQEIQR
jgi:hypothetical protein